jgi:hypothetical protein
MKLSPATLKPYTILLLLLPILSLVISSCVLSAPSERKPVGFTLSDGSKITCFEPPPDVIAKGGTSNVEVSAIRLGEVLKATGGVNLDVERIRQELPPEVASFEVFDFRMCAQYGNGVLSNQDYRAYTTKILPAYMKNPPVKTAPTTGLVEACGPSFTTKRPAAKFVPYWANVVNSLRENRTPQFHDLQNLMQVRGRIPVEQAGIDPFEEVSFTLDCLERIGTVKVEKFDPPRMLEGAGLVENRKIIFSNPSTPVPLQ